MDELFPTLTPSEIFLRLWRFRCRADSEETPEDFRLCADAYSWIRAREAEEAEKFSVTFMPENAAQSQQEAPQPTEPLPIFSPRIVLDPCPDVVMAEPEPAPEPPRPKARVTDLAKKKTRIRAELESRRETGTGLQDVVDASRGRVTMAMLLDALDAMPLTVAQWEDIGKAIRAAKIRKTWADKEAAE